MSYNNIIPAFMLVPEGKPKVASRPGSRWATGQRTKQKAFEQPKGFARGCRVSPKRDIVPKQEK